MPVILIVTERLERGQQLATLLADCGCHFDFATFDDGDLPRSDGRKIELVICDQSLSIDSGCDWLKRFRSAPALKDVPVVARLDSNDPSGVQRWLAAGADGFVYTDMSAHEVHARIRRLLRPDEHKQQRIEKTLRKNVQRQRSLLVASAQIIWTTDAEGQVVDDLPSWRAYSGQTREEVLGWGWLDTVHPDDRERTARVWSNAVAGRVLYETEYRMRRSDGVYRMFLVRGVPLSDQMDWTERYWEDPSLSLDGVALLPPDCPIREWVGTCTDIDEQRSAETLLKHERHLLRALMDNVPDAIYFKDAQSRFLHVNRCVFTRFGLTDPAQVMGKSDADFFGAEHAEKARRDEEEVIRTGVPIVAREEKEIWHDGRVAWASTTKMPLRDPAGDIVGTFGISRDITRSKQTEEELKQAKEAAEASEHRTRLIVDTANNAYIAMDADGRVVDWNREAEATFGWTRDEAMGRMLAELIIPVRFRDAHNRGLEQFLRTGHGPVLNQRIELPAMHRLRGEFPVELTISPIRLNHDHVFSAFLHDISERKRAEAELRQAKESAEAANRAKSEFLANMSHEIRTPMNAIIGMTELLADTELTPEQRDYQEMVKKSADALLQLINDILDFSKIEAGKLDFDPVDFGLREALGDTLNTLSLRAYQKGLELACHVAADVPEDLIGDPGRLRQIVTNLVGNAIKFTEHGEVVVSVKKGADSLRSSDPAEPSVELQFTVLDTGIGIPLEKQGLIFKAFTQADSSTTRRYGGTGLGLTISTRLVHLMGGRIWVESEPGRGSAFHFTAQFGLGRPARSRKPPEDLARLKDLRVLIVDDNSTNRRILEETLSHWDMKTVSAEGGKAALAALDAARRDQEPFDVILLDVQMPEMDGFTLAQHILKRPDAAGAKVLMLSSGGQPGDAARCRELGFSAYLTKPVKQNDLWRAVLRSVGVCVAEEVGHAPAEVRPVSTKSLRVLLAEDNVMNQKLAVRLLEKQGHHVAVAASGQQALDLLFPGNSAQPAFDLVLMDVQMPDMDGLEATSIIRKHEKTTGRRLPIIALTAYAMKGDRERCLSSGMDGYISKPIRPEELYAAISALRSSDNSNDAETRGAETLKQILDWDEALSHVAGDADLLREVAGLFLDQCPRWLADCREGIASGDAKRLGAAVHPLKSAFGTLAAKKARTAAAQLEELALGQELDSAPAFLAVIESELARLLPPLEAFVKRGAIP
jgi:PAS domain S-box-containing protein